MKSCKESLRQRGFAAAEDIEALKHTPQNELIDLLHSASPVIRTAAACHLSRSAEAPGTADALLSQLSCERCLYTRIAICEALQAGSVSTAEKMICYLGKIGTNQHRRLPSSVSGKKSFPLPRDLIARSLGKMSPAIFPVLLEALNSKDSRCVSEVLDAIGFMVFYHSELATDAHFDSVSRILRSSWNKASQASQTFQPLQATQPVQTVQAQREAKTGSENSASAKCDELADVIAWKALLCLSAFPLPQSLSLLEQFASRDDLLGQEARRSIDLISRRQKS